MSKKNHVVSGRNLPLGPAVPFWLSMNAHLIVFESPFWLFIVYYIWLGIWIGLFLVVKLNEKKVTLDRTLAGENAEGDEADEGETFSDRFKKEKNRSI